MKSWARQRWLWIGLGGVVIASLFVLRPGADQLRGAITGELSKALARPVTAGSVSLRFLPQPGFDLEDFAVADDPAFSNEPLLRARHVSANLRLSTLWYRRLEISSLHLTEPSLNLVLRDGRWNLESILNRAAHTPAAPTPQAETGANPHFPYIDATLGRINFKVGQEKKPWILTETDFAISLVSEDSWALSLEGRPLRTDQTLADTGLLRASATLKRAATLQDTGIAARIRWQEVQLGQASLLLTGTDPGWRAQVEMDTMFSGPASHLHVSADAVVSGFHRYDMEGSGTPKLAPHCSADYSSGSGVNDTAMTGSLTEAICTLALDSGSVEVKGNLSGLLHPNSYEVSSTVGKVPVGFLLAFAKASKRGLPSDLAADGTVDFDGVARRIAGGNASWTATGTVHGLKLRSSELKPELALGDLTLSAGPGAAKHKLPRQSTPATGTAEPWLVLEPFRLAASKSSLLDTQIPPIPQIPMLDISGRAGPDGYWFHAQGEGELQRLSQIARTLAIPVPQVSATGNAHLDTNIQGAWVGFPAPAITGTIQLRSITAGVGGVAAPLLIEHANVALSGESFTLSQIAASLGPTHWTGSASRNVACEGAAGCPLTFALQTDRLSLSELADLLRPGAETKPWYRRLSLNGGSPSALSTLQAEGTMQVGRLELGRMTANHTSGHVSLAKGKLVVTELKADMLGGKYTGVWQLDSAGKTPQFEGKGDFDGVALGQFGDLIHEKWLTGRATGSYKVTFAGNTDVELEKSLAGTLEFSTRGGGFPKLTWPGQRQALRTSSFAASVALADGKFEVQHGKLDASGGIYEVSGNVSGSRELDLEITRDGETHSVRGTLSAPKVVAAPETPSTTVPAKRR